VAQTIDIEELERLDFFPADDLPLEAESNKANDDPVSASVHSAALQREKGISRVSMWTEFVWLAKRDLLGIKRNPMTLGARLILSSFMSVLAGLIFWQVAGKETDDPIVSQVKSALRDSSCGESKPNSTTVHSLTPIPFYFRRSCKAISVASLSL
jgi:hypothetical protein